MPHVNISKFVFDCEVCHTRCDGISKGVYNFENDSSFSEQYEKLIIDRINQSGKYEASKTIDSGYPDIVVHNLNGKIHNYVEVKVQQRTFMKVQSALPTSSLMPSETVALNLSDLLRYFSLFHETNIPTSIVWVLLNRPCIVGKNKHLFFYQKVEILQQLFSQYNDLRRFRRKSGEGDIVGGIHKGVTVNYHFSLTELVPWNF